MMIFGSNSCSTTINSLLCFTIVHHRPQLQINQDIWNDNGETIVVNCFVFIEVLFNKFSGSESVCNNEDGEDDDIKLLKKMYL